MNYRPEDAKCEDCDYKAKQNRDKKHPILIGSDYKVCTGCGKTFPLDIVKPSYSQSYSMARETEYFVIKDKFNCDEEEYKSLESLEKKMRETYKICREIIEIVPSFRGQDYLQQQLKTICMKIIKQCFEYWHFHRFYKGYFSLPKDIRIISCTSIILANRCSRSTQGGVMEKEIIAYSYLTNKNFQNRVNRFFSQFTKT